ncbi:NlpC/P60 family protein, partial [Halobacillus faecis]|uniref:NlpC/P60 family protein n=1 Tax=Halobacillus faecis TaxID=360184 RepID=UPI00157FD930
SGLTHVAIYGGDDNIIHPTVSQGVVVGEMEGSSYWGPRYTEARRVEEQPKLGPTFTHPLTQEAEKHVETPYKFGGDSTEGFDSSGFVQYVFSEAVDFELPRTVSDQADLGQPVAKEDLQEGDLVFFSRDEGSGLTHVAIYGGDDKIIHPTVSRGVVVGEMEGSSYWGPRYTEARRVEEQPELGPTFTHPLTQAA